MQLTQRKTSYYTAPGIGVPQNYNMAEYIIDKVCDHYQMPKELLVSNTRKREVVWPRQIAMSLLKKYTNLSNAAIGFEFGGKDHATVLHARKVVDNMRDTNARLRRDFEMIDGIISNANNVLLQRVLEIVSSNLKIIIPELLNPDKGNIPAYKARCAAIWIMQCVKKADNKELALMFQIDEILISQALSDRVEYCSKSELYFENVMMVRNKVLKLFPVINTIKSA